MPHRELENALTKARARGEAKVAATLKDPDMLTANDFARLIGTSDETLNVKRRNGEVLGLPTATGTFSYPNWQITETGLPLPGLPRVFEILGQQPWTVYRFLRSEHAELGGRTAFAALKLGLQEAVHATAENQINGVFS